MMYVQDYDETYPYAAFWNQSTNFAANFYLWSSQRCIQPYIKNTDIYKCPDDSFSGSGYQDITNAGFPINIPLKPLSYMANAITPSFTRFSSAVFEVRFIILFLIAPCIGRARFPDQQPL
jgi:hypothetical protein